MRKIAICLLIVPIAMLLASCGGEKKTTIIENDAPATWEETIGGSAFEQANAVIAAPGGGFVIAGVTGLGGASDVYLVKINNDGEIVWERSIGGPALDVVQSIVTTSDGGYLLAGNTESMGYGQLDSYMLRVDASGAKVWDNAYGGSGADEGVFATTISDGYLLAGTAIGIEESASNLVLVHAFPTGTLRTRDVRAESEGIAAYAGAVTSDGGAIIVGTNALAGHTYPDVYLLRTDASGAVLWDYSFDGEKVITPWAITQAGADFYIVGSVADDSFSDRDAYLAKVSGTGAFLWEKRFGSDHADELHAVRAASDGGLILAGWTQALLIRGTDAYLVKTSSTGVIEWERTFGGDSFDEAFGVATTPEGGYLVVGRTASFGMGGGDFYVIKTDAQGMVEATDPEL